MEVTSPNSEKKSIFPPTRLLYPANHTFGVDALDSKGILVLSPKVTNINLYINFANTFHSFINTTAPVKTTTTHEINTKNLSHSCIHSSHSFDFAFLLFTLHPK